jgi:hypothetical protein
MKEIEINNLLWTGGWDSTFRLVYLLLIKQRPVQTYYLIDTDRNSTNLEFRAMREIKNQLFNRYPHIKDLLQPNIYKEVQDIKPNKLITECYNRMLQENHWGTQYEWLARFANEQGIKNLELCVQNSGSQRNYDMMNYFRSINDGDDNVYKVDDKFIGSDFYEIFKYYVFPVINFSKLDMLNILKERGVNEFLKFTWFCHNPRPNGKPCGNCVPCSLVIKQGLSKRLPLVSRIRYYLGISRRFRNVLQKLPRLHNFLIYVKNKSLLSK